MLWLCEVELEDENGLRRARPDSLYTHRRMKKPLSLGVGLMVVTDTSKSSPHAASDGGIGAAYGTSPVTSKTQFGSGTDLAHGSVPASGVHRGGGTESPG